MVKLITDFTGIVQFRHPNEVGGFGWVFGQVTSVATLFFGLGIARGSDKFSYDRLEELWLLSMVLTVSAIALYIIFFMIINKGFVHTFFR